MLNGRKMYGHAYGNALHYGLSMFVEFGMCGKQVQTRYHKRYQTFSFNLAWFGGYLQRLPRVTVKFIKKSTYF